MCILLPTILQKGDYDNIWQLVQILKSSKNNGSKIRVLDTRIADRWHFTISFVFLVQKSELFAMHCYIQCITPTKYCIIGEWESLKRCSLKNLDSMVLLYPDSHVLPFKGFHSFNFYCRYFLYCIL